MPFKAIAVTCALLVMVACADPALDVPAGPSPVRGPLSGTWTGTLSAPGRSQTVRIDLEEYAFGGAFTSVGTYTITSASSRVAGTASGLTTGAQASITLAPDVRPPCPLPQILPVGNVELSLVVSGDAMDGQALFVECEGSVRGAARFGR
jgi:hypothetical protein